MLSVEFLRRGTEADRWNAAALTAEGVGRQAANPPADVLASMTGFSQILGGTAWGNLFWASTLFCGFLVLAPTMVGHIDGVVRRWLDTIWTSSSRLRQVDPSRIGRIYFGLIMGYSVLGLAMLWLNAPTALIKFATISYNFALGISCCHTLILNTVLLPRELRPGWFIRIAMVLGGLFFFLLGLAATLRELGQI